VRVWRSAGVGRRGMRGKRYVEELGRPPWAPGCGKV
jgi:hypothetical protein